MEKRLLASAIALALTSGAFAQQGVFKFKYLPEQHYATQTKTTVNMSLSIKGNDAEVEKLKSAGIYMPMVLKSEDNMIAEVNTGRATEGDQAVFPVVVRYSNVFSNQTLNNKVLPVRQNQLCSRYIFGKSDTEGNFRVDSIAGMELNDDIKTAVVKMLNKLQKRIAFPDKPMNIGDTFSQEVPVNVPIPGVDAQFKVKVTYKLMAIANGMAQFAIDQSGKINFHSKQKDMYLTGIGDGTGSGTFKYDMSKSYITDMQSDLSFNYIMNIRNITMAGVASTSTSQQTVVASTGNNMVAVR
jgi:hypothetical protein